MLNEKKGRVAIWIGNLPKKSQFNAYMKETYDDPDADGEKPISLFCADMAETFYDHDFVFGEHRGAKQLSVEQLLNGWRQSHTFLAAALKLATKAGIVGGNTVLVAYDHELKPARWPEASPVRFLGNLSYSDKSAPLPQQELAECCGHQASVSRLCFSPDGKMLASGAIDGTLMAWDVATGKPVAAPQYAFQGSLTDIYELAFSADGQRCLAATLAGTRVWDGFPTADSFGKPIKGFAARAITPDGKLGLAASIGDVWVYNLASGKPDTTVHRKMKGNQFAQIAGGRIATLDKKKAELCIWNAKTAKLLHTLPLPAPADELTVSPSGTWGVTYEGTQAVVCNLDEATASPPISVDGEIQEAIAVDDASWLVLPRGKPLQVRSLRNGKLLRTVGTDKATYWRMHAAAGRVLAITADRMNIELWNLKTGKLLGRYPDQKKVKGDQLIGAAALSPDGETIACGHYGGTVQILRHVRGKLVPVCQ